MKDPVKEYCKYWIHAKADICNQPAVVIFWGKLFPSHIMGPMCLAHGENYLDSCGHSYDLKYYISKGWAIFDLTDLYRM